MTLTILDNVKRIFFRALNSLDLILTNNNLKNKNSKKYRAKRAVSPKISRDNFSRKKEVLGFKGSAYKGKGGVNKDAVMFNRFRKERPPQERHH